MIEGPDADQFLVTGTLPASIALNDTSPFTLSVTPTRLGLLNATLKIYSNDPGSPFVLPLTGVGKLKIAATKPGVPHSPFTYAPLRIDRSTGLLLQKISFTNTTGVALNGLRLVLSKVAAGIAVYSSSLGTLPGTLEVLYTNAIAANETISFDLVYSDPKRRTADSINPTITAESLEAPVPSPGPVTGILVPVLSTHSTAQGPMLEWNAKPGATYVVEYSDDSGTSWFSAVHRLGTGGTRMFWVDRGQPETQTKPTGMPNQPGGRFYRVKKL